MSAVPSRAKTTRNQKPSAEESWPRTPCKHPDTLNYNNTAAIGNFGLVTNSQCETA